MNALSITIQSLVIYFTLIVLILVWKKVWIFSQKKIGFVRNVWSFLGATPITICTPIVYLLTMRSANLVPADLHPWGWIFMASVLLLEIPVGLTGIFTIATWFEKQGWRYGFLAAAVVLVGIAEFIYIFPMF